jgi:transcriptional regulator of nitric oxide reductase
MTATTNKASAAVEESEKEDMDLSGTATKFGKLGAILVFADVVTAAVMGKSVLGVAKSLEREMEMGEDGKVREVVRERENDGERDWKEEMADKLMQRLKENKQVDAEETSAEREVADEE